MALNKNNDAVAGRIYRATALLSYLAGAARGISLLAYFACARCRR
jgi:hypothetical protein